MEDLLSVSCVSTQDAHAEGLFPGGGARVHLDRLRREVETAGDLPVAGPAGAAILTTLRSPL
jgi:hypothetical protein